MEKIKGRRSLPLGRKSCETVQLDILIGSANHGITKTNNLKNLDSPKKEYQGTFMVRHGLFNLKYLQYVIY